jgi:protease-4
MNEDRNEAAPGARPQPAASPWEREVLRDVLLATLREQRAARRWNVFFRLLFVGYLTLGLLWLLDLGPWQPATNDAPHTALIDIEGEIDSDSETNADSIVGALQAAFDDAGTKGVVLRINSPGGSPVQAGIVYDELTRLRALYPGTPVHAVIEEMGASAAYYIAAGAERIYVNRASLVGSIGVLIDTFGFSSAMQKLGIERRLLTAGADKGLLDPFLPLTDQHKRHAQATLDNIHRQFIRAVKEGRGERLHESTKLFSGLYWTGEQSIALGLADDVGSVDSVARDVFGAPDVVDYTRREDFAERLARRLGAKFAGGFKAAMTKSTSTARVR